MSNNTNNPPVETLRDGAVSAKIWRNMNKDGKPFYSVTFQRTYTDPKTNNIAESRSFQGTDLLKVPQLANEAYRTIGRMREVDKKQDVRHELPLDDYDQQPTRAPAATPQAAQVSTTPQPDAPQGLAQQRDAAMAATPASQPQGSTPAHTLDRGPSLER